MPAINLCLVFLYSFFPFSLGTFISLSNLLIIQIYKPHNSNCTGKCCGQNLDHLYINNVVSWATDFYLVLPHVVTQINSTYCEYFTTKKLLSKSHASFGDLPLESLWLMAIMAINCPIGARNCSLMIFKGSFFHTIYCGHTACQHILHHQF